MKKYLVISRGNYMMNKNYKLRYLPVFYEDLDEKLTYIAENLNNQEAAINLLNKVEEAILKRLPVAESFEPYYSIKERKYKYYLGANNLTN